VVRNKKIRKAFDDIKTFKAFIIKNPNDPRIADWEKRIEQALNILEMEINNIERE